MTDSPRFDYANTPAAPGRPEYGYSPADPLAAPAVSIVTPFYNPGLVFHETARSVLRQSLQQWEWLVVNDGSTDSESLRVLGEYRQADPRIRVIDQEGNRGPGAARNAGFAAARAEYVVQLDSDDLLEPTAIEKWLWYLTSYPEYSFVRGYHVGFGAEQYLWEKGFHSGSLFLQENPVNPNGMIRRAVHEAIGGYDEANRAGLEDWDYWLHCASEGYWGGTIPEYLDWYRRRGSHGDRWANWDNQDHQATFREGLRRRYPALWEGGFPEVRPAAQAPNADVAEDPPCVNLLAKRRPRLLLIVPWLTVGGSDRFNLELLRLLAARGWEVSIATTLEGDHAWLPEFARHTPDIFPLSHFLRLVDYPRFLTYLVQSRQIDAVLVTHSELGYLLLPYLRARCPDVALLDYCHIEEEHWRSGGYPRLAVRHQEALDLSVVASEHLKRWVVERGADPERVAVCYIDVDTEAWRPDREARAAVRRELGLAEATPVVLFVGRIHPQKQPRVLAGALLELRDRGEDFVALVAGGGLDLPWLRDFVAEHGLAERVRLLGVLSSERIRGLMAAADVLFLPSQWEGIALSIYEAMACGLAVVGAAVGGQRELVTPECGVLLPRADEAAEIRAYADTLGELLRDPARRRSLGDAARARVTASFRLERLGEEMSDLLAEARRLHVARPRPAVAPGLGRAAAAQAVEYVRLYREAEALWAECQRHRLAPAAPAPAAPAPSVSRLIDPDTVRWRWLAYYAVTRFPLRYYLRAAASRLARLRLRPPARGGEAAVERQRPDGQSVARV